MLQLKIAKIYFCLAGLLFVAKPFLGFSLFSRNHPPATQSIFVKAFTKRKVEINEDSKTGISAIQKKLAEPLKAFSLLSFFIFFAFPFAYTKKGNTTNRFLRRIRLSLLPAQKPYLLNSSFLI